MSTNIPRKKPLSPLEAIRAFCLECDGSHVNACLYPACPFYDYRLGKRPAGKVCATVKAIQTYCHEECQAGSGSHEVLTCQGDKAILGPCPVFPFRMGKNPNRSIPLSEERRAALVEAGKKHQFDTGPTPSFGPEKTAEMDRAIPTLGSGNNNTIKSAGNYVLATRRFENDEKRF